MKVLVISKPVYDYILPLEEFPMEGDKFYINNSINTLSNVGSLVAITFSRYGLDTSFTGVLGEDDIANKIKDIFIENKVDISYMETNYTEKTCISYKIYNKKTNKFTSIIENSLKTNLTKFKYEFIPEVIIMDDKDYSANLAAINNYTNAKFIFVADKYNKESSVYLNKCNYIICDLKFASDVTGVNSDLSKSKNMITLFQKYYDLYNSNLIIKNNNFDIYYCVDDEVRIIKNINKNLINKENVYYSVLSFFLVYNVDIENAIKYTNEVMLNSNSDLDMIKNIPDYKNVYDCYLEYKNLNESNQTISNVIETKDNVNIIQNNDPISQNVNQPILNNNQSNLDDGVKDVETL